MDKNAIYVGRLERTIDSLSGSRKVNLGLLLRQLKSLDDIPAAYCENVKALAVTELGEPRMNSHLQSEAER